MQDKPGVANALEVRLACKFPATLAAVVQLLEGALGEAESISRPYPNRDGGGARVYVRFIVAAGVSETE